MKNPSMVPKKSFDGVRVSDNDMEVKFNMDQLEQEEVDYMNEQWN